MKRFVQIVQILLLSRVLHINDLEAACLVKCFAKKSKKEIVSPTDYENTIEKRNQNTPRDIRIHLKTNKIENYRKYLSAKESAEWTLEKSTSTDTCINIHSDGIKNSRDTRPITWQSWQIEGKSAGSSILVLKKIIDKITVEQEQITVTVIE